MGVLIKESANFNIVVATRRQIPGTRQFVEELLVQLWSGGAAENAACRLLVPEGVRLSRQEWEDSPFSCGSYSGWQRGRREHTDAGGHPAGFRRCLQSCVICWPNLRIALDLLSRLAGWLPDADCRAWEFQELWLAAFPPARKERRRVTLAEIAARIGRTFQEPAKTNQIAVLLGGAVRFLDDTRGLDQLQALIAARSEIDFGRYSFSPDWLAQIPEVPGIYWMSDRQGKIFYVGKSRNLNQRIRSYFVSSQLWDEKLRHIHQRLYSLDFQPLGSELEAFLEEARAIEKWRPEVNFQLEVRERQAEYYRDSDLILVLPSERKNAVRLFFMRGGKFGGDFRYSGRKDQRRKLIGEIQRLFFSELSLEERWETHVLQSFIRQNLDDTNHIDVRQAASAEQCVEWVERFRRGETDDRVVFYR